MTAASSSNDAELLKTLEKAFAHHAGADAAIDIVDLQRALGLRSEYFARRIFTLFDANGDGVVSRDEFLHAVRGLVLGTPREKLGFAFRLHDHDGDGFLDRDEITRMIALSLAESDVIERATQPAEHLAKMVMSAADTNGDGRVSFEELEAVVRARPQLLARMTRSEAIWIAPNEDLLLRVLSPDAAIPNRLVDDMRRHGQRAFVVALWIAANIGVFVWSMTAGRASETADPAMRIGRALGACIDLNGGVILLPMMRRMPTWLRASRAGKVIPVDDAITFHKVVGHTLFALAVTHATAFVMAYAGGHGAAWGVITTARGATGAALLGVFAIMWLFALGFVRRTRRFELFYFTHLLYVVWLVMLVVHAPRIVIFSGAAIIAFLVEQVLRLGRRRPATRIVSAMPLRSGVTRLEIERPSGFTFSPGDYLFVRIPSIAKYEWHPFTISSAPEASAMTLHVRSLGNWSQALRAHAEASPGESLPAFIDGPYGSPTAHIFRSRIAVLIGAGIGVTPFASVLESAVLREGGAASSLEKVHFFWLNRDAYSFEWFRDLLARLEAEDARALLEINLCMTGARAGATALALELARDLMHASGRSDMITGLRTRTHFGHPDWDAMLGAIATRHRPARVDVFFCGPPGLAKKLEPICHRWGMTFREERF